MREYVLARYHARMQAAIEEFGGKCRCGSTERLQFDHVDPSTKSFTIGKMWSLSEVKFRSELKKCQLLCVPCHIAKTMAEMGRVPAVGTHGTLSAYRYCHCAICKAANADYSRKQRHEKRGVALTSGPKLWQRSTDLLSRSGGCNSLRAHHFMPRASARSGLVNRQAGRNSLARLHFMLP